MFGDDELKDWEVKDEEPPSRLQKKWEREEALDPKVAVCSSCGKETPASSLTCIFCGGFLAEFQAKVEAPWYARTSILVIGFLIVGPLALPLVWFNPAYSRRKKMTITVIVLALTYMLGTMFLRAAHTILDYYRQADIF